MIRVENSLTGQRFRSQPKWASFGLACLSCAPFPNGPRARWPWQWPNLLQWHDLSHWSKVNDWQRFSAGQNGVTQWGGGWNPSLISLFLSPGFHGLLMRRTREWGVVGEWPFCDGVTSVWAPRPHTSADREWSMDDGVWAEEWKLRWRSPQVWGVVAGKSKTCERRHATSHAPASGYVWMRRPHGKLFINEDIGMVVCSTINGHRIWGGVAQ
jgi:hypothetical protein